MIAHPRRCLCDAPGAPFSHQQNLVFHRMLLREPGGFVLQNHFPAAGAGAAKAALVP
jgi:hypothetical protein